MKHKGLIALSLAGAVAGASLLAGCEWRPFGRDYFVSEGDGKAGYSYGEPWINSVTYGTVNKDTKHDKNEDFYLATNFDKIISTTIEEGQTEAGVKADAAKKIKDNLLSMLQNTSPENPKAKQVADLYALFNDKEAREGSWERDIIPRIKELQEADSLSAIGKYLSSENYYTNGTSLVSFDYDIDYNDTDNYCYVIVPTALSLGDSAEYSSKSDYGTKTEDIFKKQSKLLLQKSGYSDDGADTIIKNALKFEADIAGFIKNQEFKATPEYIQSINNTVSLADIKKAQGDFPLDEILKSYGLESAKSLYLLEPDWLSGMKNIYNEDNFENIKSYLLIKTLQSYADIADVETYTGMRDIYNEAYEIKKSDELEDYSYTFVKNNLSGTIAQLYCDKYINEAKVNEVKELASELINEYKLKLSEIDYLSEATKTKAALKLDNMKLQIAGAGNASDDAPLEFKSAEEGGDLVSAVIAIRKTRREDKLKYLDREVSAEDFEYDPTDTGINYWNLGNVLCISPGALSDDIFSEGMSLEEKLGGLGTQIAAALGKALYGQGSLYDESGKYSSLWSAEDTALYNEHFKGLKESLDKIKPFKNDRAYDGAKVLDNMVCEIKAFEAVSSLSEKKGADLEKLKEEFAKSRFTLMREEVMENAGLNSNEALPYIVVNTVSDR